MPNFGYAGEILKVDLSNRKTEKIPSKEYTDRFIGGHGVSSKLYWDLAPANVKYNDPANAFICAVGPITGFSGFAGSRWKIVSKTPFRHPASFCYANLGEKWGLSLKACGYDAVAVQGKADKLVYLYLHDGKAEFKDAAHLKGKTVFETIDTLKAELGEGASVLANSPAGENDVTFSTVGAEGGAKSIASSFERKYRVES